MAPKVYLETSVISYLSARPARDVVVLAHQQLTREWWDTARHDYELYSSEIVYAEAEKGDPDAARARLDVLHETQQLADMSHIALATVHGMQFLLTWNCKHIANANVLRAIARTCRERGYDLPVICTSEELTGNRYVE